LLPSPRRDLDPPPYSGLARLFARRTGHVDFMAKFKPAGSRKAKTPTTSLRGAIPCFVVILVGFTLIFLLFYEVLKSGK
jgi:hypothetical protein